VKKRSLLEAARGGDDEDVELGLRDRVAVRARRLGEEADDDVDVLDVVDRAAVRMAEAVVDRRLGQSCGRKQSNRELNLPVFWARFSQPRDFANVIWPT
jgi:hypothetical protein